MTMLTTLKSTGRAALVAVALGATAFTAVPAQAAPQNSFSLQLNGGNGNSVQFGNNQGSVTLRFGNDFANYCLTNKQIRNALEDYGFRKVQIVKKINDRKVVVVARYSGVWYEMRVDRCSGKVDKVKKLKKQNFYGNNFSFTITF
jgi:hypothetical protein